VIILQELYQHGGKSVDSIGRKSLGTRQILKGKVSPVDGGTPVNQVKTRCWWHEKTPNKIDEIILVTLTWIRVNSYRNNGK